MNPRFFNRFACAGAFLLCLGLSARSQVATTPVGYLSVTIPAATSSTLASGTVISIPFYQSPVYSGTITSVDSSSAFSNTTASWTASQFTASPYLVHFTSGTSVGRFFIISANTTNQLTVDNRGFTLTSVLAAGDSFEIIPANTLATLFGSSSVLFQTGASASASDNVLIWNGSGWDTYYHNGTNWKKSGSLTNQNNAILYPDEGLYITRRLTSSLTLTFSGLIPTVSEKSDVLGPGSTFMSNRFPVNTTISSLGLQQLANWQTGASANAADNVLIWNGSGWDTYYYNGSNWRKSGNLSPQDSAVIPTGTAVFIVRKSTGSGAAASLSQALPYTL